MLFKIYWKQKWKNIQEEKSMKEILKITVRIIEMNIAKNIGSSFCDIDADIPRDRDAQFGPKVMKKYETVYNELDKKVIALYAKGMSTRDIQSEIEALHEITISSSMVSQNN